MRTSRLLTEGIHQSTINVATSATQNVSHAATTACRCRLISDTGTQIRKRPTMKAANTRSSLMSCASASGWHVTSMAFSTATWLSITHTMLRIITLP